MKTRIVLLLLTAALIMANTSPLYSQNAEQLYQKALMKEEGEGNLQEAINIYNQIAQNESAEISIRAKALLHVGLCYEKMGKEEATKAYQKLVNNFPTQKNEVAIARERLSRLILASGIIEPETLTPKFTKIKIPTKLSWSVKLSPDGKKLAHVSDKKLWITPLAGNLGVNIPGTPVQLNTNGIDVEWTGLDWSGDGNWIVFNDYPKHDENGEYIRNQSIFMVPSSGGTPKKIIENYRDVRVVNYRISLSHDAKKLAFTSVEENKQHIFSTSIDNIVPSQLVEMEAREPVFSPNGKYVAFVKDKNRGIGEGDLGLWVVKEEGGTPNKLADAGKASSPVWSPDGKMIAYIDYTVGKQINIVPFSITENNNKKVVSIEAPTGTEEVRLLAGWTPDNKIGALITSKQEFGLYTLPAEGGQAAKILQDSYALQPRWSGNGEEIYYVATPEEGDNRSYRRFLASVSADGGTGKPLQTNINGKSVKQFAFQSGNRVSPDGKWIVTSTWIPKKDTNSVNVHWPTSKIWKVSVNSQDAIQITNTPGNFSDMSPCWSPDGKNVAFVRFQLEKGKDDIFGGAPKIYSINSSGGEPELLVSISGKYVNSVIWSPDGRTIAYLTKEINQPHTKNLNLYDLETKESRIVGNIEAANVNNEMAWSPDSKRIAFNDAEGKVIKIITLSDERIEEISTGLVDANIYHLDWSPDGRRFVFCGWKGGEAEFWFMEDFLPFDKLAQKEESKDVIIRKFMEGTGAQFYGAPSPNGKHFAFVDYKTSPNDIVIKDIETEYEIRLRNQTDLNYKGDQGIPYNPIWSPDSKQLAYVWENDKDNFYELRIVRVDNPEPKALIKVSYDENGWIKSEDWSPDGKYILAQLSENNMYQLGLVSVFNGSFQQLKKIKKPAPFSAKFSPDGKYVAYDTQPNEENTEHDIFVISTDGKQESKITSHPSHDYFLDWSTSGKKILFASDRTGTTDMWSIPFNSGSTIKAPELVSENIGNIKALGTTNEGSFYYSTPGSWWDIYTTTIDPISGKVIAPPTEVPLPYQGYNRHPIWSPDGKYLAYVSVRRHLRKPNILCIYTKETGEIKEFVFEKDVNRPVWFPNSQSVLLFGTNALNTTTGKIESVIQLKKEDGLEKFAISISSDGKSIYYETRNESWDKHAIVQMNIENGEEKELYATTDDNLTMSLSPDNKQLALLQRHNEDTRILKILFLANGSEKEIYSFQQDDFGYIDIAWSPDGKYIYFSKIADSAWELCRIPAIGGELENLDVHKNLFTSISAHPNGQLLTFNSFVGKEKPGGIWVMQNLLQELDKIYSQNE